VSEHKPLTKWEAGQELIRAADCLSAVAFDLKDDWPEFADAVRKARERIAEQFNKECLDTHGFGL
jgi:hypothetical protein